MHRGNSLQSSTITFRGSPPGQLSTSGLTIVEESLVHGRFAGRMFASTGFVNRNLWPVHGCVETPDLPPFAVDLPIESFDLEIDGQSLQGGWEWMEAEQYRGEKVGYIHGAVCLRNTRRPVRLTIHTLTDGTGFIVRWLEISNTSDRPAALSHVAPWCGLLWQTQAPAFREYLGEDATPYLLGRCTQQEWGREGAFRWQPLPHGTLRLEHLKGTSGNDDPYFVLCNEVNGEIVVGALAWSGNWAFSFHANIPDSAASWVSIKAEIVGDAPLRVIAAGEAVTTPAVHIGLFRGDLDTAVQALHDHERRTVVPPQPEELGERVIYNHWGYAEWRMSTEYLMQEIDVAADVGAELFVVDAGWFSPFTGSWWDSVGDWRPHPERLPGGLQPIVDHAHEKGLLIGLWVEAERVAASSWVAREHPEWIQTRDGKPLAPGGTEPGGTLNLAHPDCAAWLEAEVNRIVDEYGIDMFRLDYNFYPGRGGENAREGFVESEFWRHYEALYGIFDRLRARHPRLLLENCAGGGGRKDLGIAARFHTLWTSDWQMLPRTLQVLNGVSLFLPPERLNRLAGVGQEAHFHGDLDTQLRVPLFCHYALSGLTPDVSIWNPLQKQRVKHYIGLYKEWVRPWLATCRVYHHTPVLEGYAEPRGWCVLEYAAADRSRAMVGLFRLAGHTEETFLLHARGLDPGTDYRVTWDATGQSAVIDGWRLINEGLVVRRERPLTSELLLLERLQE